MYLTFESEQKRAMRGHCEMSLFDGLVGDKYE